MSDETNPEMISPEKALDLILGKVTPTPTESVPLVEASGRVSVENLQTDIDLAPFDHSSMDGYAIHVDDLSDASASHPITLHVIAEEGAGHVFEGDIPHGSCVRIMTGAAVPAGLDAVVKQEIVTVVKREDGVIAEVSFTAPASVGENIRPKGQEAHAGEVVVGHGEVINPAGVGFLASCGITSVLVHCRPRVAVIATGTELVDPSKKPAAGQIRNSNSYALAASVVQAGGVPDVLPICPDDEELLSSKVVSACVDHDFVVTTGGAANGDFDFIKQVIAEQGELCMSLVNMRPGKAQAFGIVDGTPVMGLSGNPAASYVGFQMLIRPALLKMQGYTQLQRPSIKARLTKDQHRRDPRRTYLRATLERTDDGLVVTPYKNQSSGLFGPLQKCNCLAVLPEGDKGMAAGDEIECILVDVPEGVVLS